MVFFVVARDTSGIGVREVGAVDGGLAATLSFTNVVIEDSAWLKGASEPQFNDMHDQATVVACAKQVGSMQAVVRATIEYTRTRQQFGQPLSAHQIIRHRLADMSIACEEAQAIVQGSVLEMMESQHTATVDEHAYARAASLARVKVSKVALKVFEEAIQLHGGMGVTDELSIAHFLRRHLALDAMYGDGQFHLRRYAALPSRLSHAATGIGDAPALVDFRDEVQRFIHEPLSTDLKQATPLNTSVFSEPSVSLTWQRKLFAQGWVAPAWPVEYGGTGYSLAQRWIFETEMAQAGAPSLSPLGLRMAGRVIMKFGSGSDLASLKMRAEHTVVEGEAPYYLINGSKIWTSHAQHANRMFALVRTGDDREVNQVFFDDVRVPVSCRLGDEGQGWKIAKYLLEFELGGSITAGQLRAALGDSQALMKQQVALCTLTPFMQPASRQTSAP